MAGRFFTTEPPGKPGDPEFFGENTEVTGVPLWWNLLEIFPLGYQGKLFMGMCLTEALHYKLPRGVPGEVAGHWLLLAAMHSGNPEAKPFLPAMFPSSLLIKLSKMPAGKEKVVLGSSSIFIEQAKRVTFFF